MWFDARDGQPDWSAAQTDLAAADPRLAAVVARVGPCTLAPLPDPFEALVLSIFSQQLSVKGAETLYKRFRDKLPRRRVTPGTVHAALAGRRPLDDDTIRTCGISRQKRAYLADLSSRLLDGRLLLDTLPMLDDAGVVANLTEVKGVGVWTAQMYLMFVLCRPDVLPVADLGLQEATRRVYHLPIRPAPGELAALALPWTPWRTVASWYLWRAKEG